MSTSDKKKYDEVASAMTPDQTASERVMNLTIVAEDLEKAIKVHKLDQDARVQIDANGLLLEFSEKPPLWAVL